MAESDWDPADERGLPVSVLLIRSARALLNIAGALLISAIFLLMLTTAIAQQSILAALNDGEPELSYSTAHAMIREVEERKGQLRDLADEIRSISSQHAAAQRQFEPIATEYEAAWEAFATRVQRVSERCEIPRPEGVVSREARLEFWSEAEQCLADERMPTWLRERVLPLFEEDRNFLRVAQEYGSSQGTLNQLQARLTAAQEALTTARQVTPEERKALRSFDDSNVLRESLWLGGDFLIAFPPSLLQLYLAAASGAFGALLFTLVLIVYPRSSLKITSAGSYGARVLLGALIAVCVYIILLGGTAVLGTESMAGANYMTFCAVAVLAGMFSDRVADWLSRRANTFFRQREAQQAADEPGATTATPPA